MTEHLSRLTLTLEVDAPLERARVATLGPHLHGVLMESIPADYVQTLHTVPVNPYSQYALARSTTSLEWKISTLTNEARQQIVGPINDAAFAGFRLRASGIATQVTSRSLEQNPLSQFARIFYARPETRKFRVEFLTPTAFKQSGEYVFWLYSALCVEALRMGGQQLLGELVACSTLRLTDLLPYVGPDYLVPKPLHSVRSDGSSMQKKLAKKIGFLPAAQLGSFLDGTADLNEPPR